MDAVNECFPNIVGTIKKVVFLLPLFPSHTPPCSHPTTNSTQIALHAILATLHCSRQTSGNLLIYSWGIQRQHAACFLQGCLLVTFGGVEVQYFKWAISIF